MTSSALKRVLTRSSTSFSVKESHSSLSMSLTTAMARPIFLMLPQPPTSSASLFVSTSKTIRFLGMSRFFAWISSFGMEMLGSLAFDSRFMRKDRAWTAPSLSRGLLPFPHFGDWMQEGQPISHSHDDEFSGFFQEDGHSLRSPSERGRCRRDSRRRGKWRGCRSRGIEVGDAAEVPPVCEGEKGKTAMSACSTA